MKYALVCVLTLPFVAGGLGCSSPSKDGVRELKLAYVMAPGGPAHEAAEYFTELVEKKTEGKLCIKLFPSAQLGNDRELAEAVMIGSVDMVLSGTAPIGWYLPEYAAIEAPFTFRSYEHLDRVLQGEIGHEIAEQFSSKRRTRILGWWHRGPRYLTTTSRRVTEPADLEGLKLRVPELPTYIEAWRILGANPTPITYSEIFMAIKQGIVEGQENPLEVIHTSSFAEVQKYVMETKHLLGVYMFMINEPLFDHLPPEQRQAITDAVKEAGDHEHELMIEYDQRFAEQLEDSGMQFIGVDRDAFRQKLAGELPKRFTDEWKPGLYERIVAVE